MDLRQKTNTISMLILIICILIGVLVYIFTGIIFFAIIFAPPIVHWALKRREKQNRNSGSY